MEVNHDVLDILIGELCIDFLDARAGDRAVVVAGKIAVVAVLVN